MLILLKSISFTVPGDPFGKERARSGRGGRHYTPHRTVAYEKLIGEIAARALAQARFSSLQGPLHIELRFFCPIPKSWPKYKKEAAAAETVWCPVKPDSSNVLKAIEDGMNKIAYADDAQICSHAMSKIYSPNPRVEVALSELVGSEEPI